MMRRALMSAARSSQRAPSSMTSSTSSAMFVVPRRAYPAQDFVDNTRTPANHMPAVGKKLFIFYILKIIIDFVIRI
jgi:hypothetical protein